MLHQSTAANETAVRADGGTAPTLRISVESGRLLTYLKANAQGSAELGEVARDMRMSRAAVARALRELERTGLVSLHIEED